MHERTVARKYSELASNMSITPSAPTHTRMSSAIDLRRARLQCRCTHEASRTRIRHQVGGVSYEPCFSNIAKMLIRHFCAQEDPSGCLPQSRRAQLLSLAALLTLPLAQQRAAWSTPVVKVRCLHCLAVCVQGTATFGEATGVCCRRVRWFWETSSGAGPETGPGRTSRRAGMCRLANSPRNILPLNYTSHTGCHQGRRLWPALQ